LFAAALFLLFFFASFIIPSSTMKQGSRKGSVHQGFHGCECDAKQPGSHADLQLPGDLNLSDNKGRKEGTTISSSSSATSFTQQRIPSCPARIFLVEQSKQETRCLGRMKVAESEAEPTQGILEAKRSTTRFPNFFPSNTFLPWEYPSPSETKDR